MNTTMAFVLLMAIIAVSVGLARLVVWFFDRREADAARVIAQASLLARAEHEVRRG